MDFNPFLIPAAAPTAAAHAPPGPPLTIVTGGVEGVGTTTLAIRLSIALAADAQRVVLIDADLDRPDVTAKCGLSPRAGVHDVLAGKRTIHEALERGPAGIQVLSGGRSAVAATAWSDRGLNRLEKQIGSLAPHADQIVVDLGGLTGPLAAALWQRAQHAVLVTVPTPASITECYALLKTLVRQRIPEAGSGNDSARPPSRIELFVNQCETALAADVHRRFDQSCRRFLGFDVSLAGWAPRVEGALGDPAESIHQGDLARPVTEAMARLAQRLTHAEQAAEPAARAA